MSFVNFGTGGSEPSFLELIAVQRLDKGVREAFSYCLSVSLACCLLVAHCPTVGGCPQASSTEASRLVGLLSAGACCQATQRWPSPAAVGRRGLPAGIPAVGGHLSACKWSVHL